MGIRILRMERRHLPVLAALEATCFSHPWKLEGLTAELEKPEAVFLVAESGDAVAGYLGAHHILDEVYIANLAVFPAYRRQGIGGVLLDALCCYAVAEGASLLTLEVRVSNQAAIRLYAGKGFQPQGIRPHFYEDPREDAIIMTKFLKEFS